MPLHLSLLGASELRDEDGAMVDAVLSQPKRLALLAYLAVDPPVRLHRRDALLLLLWPESDESHARGALSQALTFLRRALGDGVIVSRGLEEVGIDPARLATDVDAFTRDAEAGTHYAALTRYRGDLLAGLNVPGCHEFDEWMSAERARLRAMAVRSARKASEAALAARDGSTALLSARHGLLLAPLDESLLEQVMLAHDLAGRPAVALHEFEEFRRRLRAELGVEPSARLQALAARLRGTDAR